jgi:drug/metabolite transporter (DMT)-like permease
MKNATKGRLVLAFATIYIVWGTTYLANLFALESMKPFVISSVRYIAAGVILALWVLTKKMTWPDAKSLKVLIISGIIMLVGGSGLVVYGEQYVNSGYAAVVIATEPFWFVILDKVRWKLYFSDYRIVTGLVLGFVGIALFSYLSPDKQFSHSEDNHKLIGTVVVLVSSLLWVVGALYANKRLKKGSSNASNTMVQLFAAGIFSGLIASINGEWQSFEFTEITARAWGGLLFLIIMGTLLAYLAFTWLLTVQPPAIVSTHTYVNPVVAILIGWLFAGETITYSQLLALVIVLLGVVLTQSGKQRITE